MLKGVVDNINNRMDVILKSWDVENNVGTIVGSVCSLKEYFCKELESVGKRKMWR